MSVATAPLAPLVNRFLKMAVLRGVEESVRLHLDRGDDVNARDEQGLTLLMLAAARNHGSICRLLLEAGADSDLLDSQGHDALAISIRAEASEARQALEGHSAHASSRFHPDTPEAGTAINISANDPSVLRDSPAPWAQTTPPTPSPAPQPAERIDLANYSDGDTSMGDWEAEDRELPPEGDPALVAPTFAAQAAITRHIPFDTSADWSDFEVFLPDWAAPLPRGDDSDIRESLRLLILRAVRESSVPGFAVEDLSRAPDGTINEDGESQLRMVLNDLGAEIDERLEIDFPFESHVVFVKPEETDEETA